MTMISGIEKSVRKRGWATPAEILHDIGARDCEDRGTACALIEEMVRERKLEPREIRSAGIRLPVFGWNFYHQTYRGGACA